MSNPAVVRVARSYQIRQSGLLQAPPAMLKEIQDWAISILASTHLSDVLERDRARVRSFIKGVPRPMRKKGIPKVPSEPPRVAIRPKVSGDGSGTISGFEGDPHL